MKKIKRENQPLEITLEQERKEHPHEGLPVLVTDFALPVLSGGHPRATARLNRYYALLAREKTRYAEQRLLPAAVKAHTEALAEGRLLPPFALTVRSTVTLADTETEVFSLYTDVTESTGGRDVVTLRYSDTFSLRDGLPVPALRPREKGEAIRLCRELAEERNLTGRIRRFGWGPLGRGRFRRDQCCRAAEGRIVFFQPGEIAPPERGVVEFAIEM